MSHFFIDRPIFAWVIAIVIMLAGALAIRTLPISQYPNIAPPSVSISASYPGASAKTLEDTVTQVIEQKMKGIDNLDYMAATSDSQGNAQITLTFAAGTDPDIAQVQVQNKVQLATALLPQEVQQQGLTVTKSTSDFLMVMGFVSENDGMTQSDLSDYLAANVEDQISRVDGVGDVTLFGAQYAMRIWLDPSKLNNYKLTPADVTTAIEAQNTQVSAGSVGGSPAAEGQQLTATVTAQSRLQTAEQFRAVLLVTNTDGSTVRLRDVARVELGSESYDTVARYNGKPATGLAIKLATGANALNTATAVKARIAELAAFFPAGMKVVYPYDTTPFVRISIEEVVKTLVEAIILVFVVMFVFLQNFRATLIPTIAVPVVLLGTFGVLAVFGYSINTLTMFGAVLAIGLLVDDAIVVVENVERVMREEGLSPRDATRKSMSQITGALVGIALVLSAVFVPMAFFGGSTGVIYRQFSITIASAMVLSVLVALTLTPALCASLLTSAGQDGHAPKRGPFAWFNRAFNAGNRGYQTGVSGILKRSKTALLVYLVLIGGMVALFMRLPTAYLPDEDQGLLFVQVQLPVGATQERTVDVLRQVEHHFLVDQKDAVNSIFTVAGFSFGGAGENTGIGFISLKDWSQRTAPGLAASSVVGKAYAALSSIRSAVIFAFMPPSISGLGNSTGFDMQLQDVGGLGHDALIAARNELLTAAAKDPVLSGVRPNGQDDTPQLHVEIDQAKAGALGVALADINDTLATAWGGTYVNDFIDRGRVKKVYVQGDAPFRASAEDLDRWYVRNGSGAMVPFSAFAKASWTYGSPRLERYNGVSSVEILGDAAAGRSTGEAMTEMESLAAKLPAGIGYQWTGLSRQEKLSGSQAPALYAISTLVVFLCLAALYESWSIPFSVMLVVPLGVLGALVAADLRGLSNDVFFQVGLLTTIGLSAKNAILIVEFAKELQEQGMGLIDATMHAVGLRLRPILMTSLAFILGMLPMVLSTGAGAGGRTGIGTGVTGGMISATVLGVFLVPVFFVVIRRIFKGKAKPAGLPAAAPAE
ncbi:efflux RND transporter permease subunit [Dongia sedimenti]|uniref:Efflux pump membrane transporter n=1 Tax=Dongia sedimenti TaxID=3064282 RepID=A0ABU0YLH3_9PROT|nr:efflux RND transporter permease subunit [Rhodospirillaceae bacterium R-7]